MMSEMQLSAITIFPIKSLRGIALEEAEITQRGLASDRRWMLVDNFGEFMTQREHPRMALVSVSLTPHGLLCVAPEGEPLLVPYAPAGNVQEVRIWKDTVSAQGVSREADQWFSRFLDLSCHLVMMPETTERQVD